MIDDNTSLLEEAAQGNQRAADELLPLVYDELRQLARRAVGGGEDTLRATALVHEVYLKLAGARTLDWRSETHFRAIAARAMEQVLADHARARRRAKRGGGWNRVTLGGIADDDPQTIPAGSLADALERLREQDERAASIVVLRFIGGLEEKAIAHVLGISERTVRRDWHAARAWLHSELTGG